VRAADVISLENRRFVLALFGNTADLIQLLWRRKIQITFRRKRKSPIYKSPENIKNSDV
jgi:hypothetical protein